MAKKLTIEDREIIYRYKSMGLRLGLIATIMGRHRSTIIREIKRNGAAVNAERGITSMAKVAHKAAHERRVSASKRKMRLKTPEIREFVEKLLKDRRAPANIASRIQYEISGASISGEAIYQWILYERQDLIPYLRYAGKKRWPRRSGKGRRLKQPAAPKVSIEDRPKSVERRLTIGNLEQDAICSKQGVTAAIMNITDRASRRCLLNRVPNLESDTYSKKLIDVIKEEVPEEFRLSLTQDNGKENAQHPLVAETLKIDNFFTHAYASSEKGTTERLNRTVRIFIPKGTDIGQLPDELLRAVQDWSNNNPMLVLHGLTPNEVWAYGLRHGGKVPRNCKQRREAVLHYRENLNPPPPLLDQAC
jgi:IS30 family transposase